MTNNPLSFLESFQVRLRPFPAVAERLGRDGDRGRCRASRQQIIERCRSPQVCSHCRANRKGICRGGQVCSHCRVNRPHKIESSRGRDACSQSRVTTRGNIVELNVRQIYRTFSIRRSICSIRDTDGRRQRHCGHQTNDSTPHRTHLHNKG